MVQNITVRKLFENYVILRDLDGTKAGMPSLSILREKSDIPPNVVPRKNEPDYAKVVESFVYYVSGGDVKNIFYIGDSVFNDGNVIKNVATRRNYEILGFICNEARQHPLGEFILREIIFSDQWSHLWKLVEEGQRRRFDIGPKTVVIFDLDQTVYAAKGRDSEPLKEARLDAVTNLLFEVIGEERYDAERVERYYREFDRDYYHRFTRDNQDYVVFLTLICLLGLTDVDGIRKVLSEPGKSMDYLIETMRVQVERRKAREDLERAWQIVQEVYFNNRAGDQTPLKSFRAHEYLSTAKRMSVSRASRSQNLKDAIVISREIVDFICFVRRRGGKVLALSDRPVEATEPSEVLGPNYGSILDIKMSVSGESITDKLESLVSV